MLGLYVGFDFKQIPAILSELKLGNPVEIDFTTAIIVIGVFAVIGLMSVAIVYKKRTEKTK